MSGSFRSRAPRHWLPPTFPHPASSPPSLLVAANAAFLAEASIQIRSQTGASSWTTFSRTSRRKRFARRRQAKPLIDATRDTGNSKAVDCETPPKTQRTAQAKRNGGASIDARCSVSRCSAASCNTARSGHFDDTYFSRRMCGTDSPASFRNAKASSTILGLPHKYAISPAASGAISASVAWTCPERS